MFNFGNVADMFNAILNFAMSAVVNTEQEANICFHNYMPE